MLMVKNHDRTAGFLAIRICTADDFAFFAFQSNIIMTDFSQLVKHFLTLKREKKRGERWAFCTEKITVDVMLCENVSKNSKIRHVNGHLSARCCGVFRVKRRMVGTDDTVGAGLQIE